MKKVLFIIQSYPSEKSANVLCDEKIMRALISTGKYEVHCLCYRYDDQPLEDVINGIHVHRWDRGAWWRLYSKAEYRGMSNGKIVIELHRIFMRLKQILFVPIFPIYEPMLAINFKSKAIELYNRLPFDLVIAEHNGLDTLYAGWKLKQLKKPAFVPVFWDSLSGGFRPKYLPVQFVDKRKSKLEKKVLDDCDCAIMMQSHEMHVRNLYAEDIEILNKIAFLDIPYLDINNGKSKSYPRSDRINIVFAGNMSMRDPTFFFRVVEVSDVSNIVIHFFTNQKDHAWIREIAKNHHIQIEMHDYISHDKLIEHLGNADILLNFGVDNPNAISGKVFEYIGFMKPIISTYSIDDEAVIPVLKKYPAALLLDERKPPEVYRTAIRKLISDYAETTIDAESIKLMFRKNMPEAYVEIIEDILEECEK